MHQITFTQGETTYNLNPAIDAVGSRIAFESNANLLGTNPDGNLEIVLWDAFTGFVQITSTTGGQSVAPTINAAGTRVSFESNADPLGSNGDGNFEIFLWDSSAGLTQITNTASGDNRLASIDATGNRIAFASSSDLVGSNGDGSFEIFLWDSSAGLIQITNTTAGRLSFSPSINAAGNRIAFESNANLTGGNGDLNVEIFLWDASTGIAQLTNTSPFTGNNGNPAINAAGDGVAFEFGFPSQIFLWDAVAGITPVSGSLSQPSVLPSINAAGTRIAFRSDGIYLWDASTGLTQVAANTGGISDAPAINAAGNRIAFHSNGDLLGTNADGSYELFLFACPPLSVVEVPAVSPAGLGTLAALLGLAAAWTLRRRMTEQR
ncbi:MAG TPA: IPTL-CTERM sorting domain-containing protein [Thermoanaerobaculia bacterium]|nr:IPTL-CTERM sorting domain-containing protein [Thermoanaerobaculia bacterium]